MRIALAVVALWMAAPAAAEDLASRVFGGTKVEDIYRVRLDRGELLLESLMQIIKMHNIQDGALLTAAGTLSECTWHAVASTAEKPEQKFTTRKGPMEILNINGIIAGGEPHFHMTLSDHSGGMFGGHLENGCKVLYRAELTIAKFSGTKVARLPNKAGVPVMQRK